MAFSPDGKTLASGSWGSQVRLWGLSGFSEIKNFMGLSGPQIAVSPSGKTVVIVDSWSHQLFVDGDGELLSSQDGASKGFCRGASRIQFSPDGRRLLLVGENRAIQFLDLEAKEKISYANIFVSVAAVTRFLDDESVLYRIPQGQRLVVWKPDSGKAEYLERQKEGEPYVQRVPICADVSRDGKLIAVGYWEGYVRVLDRDGKQVWKSPRVGMVRSVRLSKDGRYVLVASEDGFAHLWDRQTGVGKRVGSHFSGVNVAIFSPDESRIAAATKSGRTRVWDRNSGELRLDLTGHKVHVNDLAYTDSGRLVSAGNDGRVLWWWTDPEKLRRVVESLPVPELTAAERKLLPQLFPQRFHGSPSSQEAGLGR